MYKNKNGEDICVRFSEYNMNSVDTPNYNKITRIINPFNIDLTSSENYGRKDICFLEIIMEYEDMLVVFKTKEDPRYFSFETEATYNPATDGYDDLFEKGVLNIHLLNDDNQLVLMYGTSIITLDIDTFEVINYTNLDNVENYCLKLAYENGIYYITDALNKIIKLDKNLNLIV